MVLREGKLPRELMRDIVFNMIRITDPDVVQGPGVGEDASIVHVGDGHLVFHTDPITTSARLVGWLAIHVSANDVAVRGVRPRWFSTAILLPPGAGEEELREIIRQEQRAVEKIGGSIVGGHTEVTPGIPRPVVVSTAIGYTRRGVIRTRDASPGDYVVLVGRVAGEGAAVLAWDFPELLEDKGVPRSIIEEARSYIWDVSVVEPALILADTHVNSMHDPTEGGVVQGLLEIAVASGHTLRVDLDSIVLDEKVAAICRALGIDPFRLLSSGALLATIPPHALDDALGMLEHRGYGAQVIGRVEKGGSVLVVKQGGREEVVSEDVVDEIYRVWTMYGKQ